MKKSLSSWEFSLLQKFIEEQSGIVLGQEKAYFIESRLANILDSECLSSYEELFYKAYNKKDTSFSERVIDSITTNETYWFRDKNPWCILEEILLPIYIKEMQDGTRDDVRIWSCACSSGQEPYSIAMCIDSYLRKNGINNVSLDRFNITATDLSGKMVNLAVNGKYDHASMERGLDPNSRDRYFIKEDKYWFISEKIKNAVTFHRFNIKSGRYIFNNYDIIFCRNVLIYFSDILKEEILQKIVHALKPNGVLFIGASEIITDSSKYFKMETYKDGVYFKQKG